MHRPCCVLLAFLLVSCAPVLRQDQDYLDLASNPIMAEVIGDQTIDFLTELEVRGEVTDPDVRRAMEVWRGRAQDLVQDGHARQDAGRAGRFAADQDFLEGEVLLLERTLYFGYDFETDAIPDLQVALSPVLIPRTYADFQSQAGVPLGPLHSTIGPQSYELPPGTDVAAVQAVVIYSDAFKRVVGFAQLES